MDYYVGIDVSLEASSLCVVDASGKIVREAKVSSEPEDLIAWFEALPFCWRGSALRRGHYRNGLTQALRKRGSLWSYWRRGMCAMPSRRCR